jgi:probable rRNA maturation factor
MIILRRKLQGVSESGLARFTARARRAAGVSGGVDVLLTGDAEMRRLNRRFRRKDRTTDVLSFPDGADGRGGDIAISAATAARNARRLGHTPAQEIKALILHGLLHLAGYDHASDHGQMARREARLRRQLELPVSLTERAAAAGRRR